MILGTLQSNNQSKENTLNNFIKGAVDCLKNNTKMAYSLIEDQFTANSLDYAFDYLSYGLNTNPQRIAYMLETRERRRMILENKKKELERIIESYSKQVKLMNGISLLFKGEEEDFVEKAANGNREISRKILFYLRENKYDDRYIDFLWLNCFQERSITSFENKIKEKQEEIKKSQQEIKQVQDNLRSFPSMQKEIGMIRSKGTIEMTPELRAVLAFESLIEFNATRKRVLDPREAECRWPSNMAVAASITQNYITSPKFLADVSKNIKETNTLWDAIKKTCNENRRYITSLQQSRAFDKSQIKPRIILAVRGDTKDDEPNIIDLTGFANKVDFEELLNSIASEYKISNDQIIQLTAPSLKDLEDVYIKLANFAKENPRAEVLIIYGAHGNIHQLTTDLDIERKDFTDHIYKEGSRTGMLQLRKDCIADEIKIKELSNKYLKDFSGVIQIISSCHAGAWVG